MKIVLEWEIGVNNFVWIIIIQTNLPSLVCVNLIEFLKLSQKFFEADPNRPYLTYAELRKRHEEQIKSDVPQPDYEFPDEIPKMPKK